MRFDEIVLGKSLLLTKAGRAGRIVANVALGVLFTAGISSAQFTGTVWENTPDAGNASDTTNMGSTLASAQFVSSAVQFCSVPGGEPGCPGTSAYTVGAFLNNPVFTNPVNGFDPTVNLDNTEVQLTGSIFLSAGANNFIIGHDDGFTMQISGGPGTVTCSTQSGTLCVNVPGETAFASTPFTITPTVAGIYNFTLNYSECCGPPAYLLFAYANGAPVGSAQIFKSFGAASIPLGGTTSLSFTVLNPNASGSLTSIAFTDTLPAGLAVTTPNGLTGSCGGGTIVATAGSGVVSLSGATLSAGASCTFSLNVTGIAVGTENNSVTVTSNVGMGNTATASVAVIGPPVITKVFGAASITVGGSTSLTFTIGNPISNPATLMAIAFTDSLPSGLIVAAPNGLTGSCGAGTITAVARSTTVSLSGAALAPGASCTFSVNVSGTTVGPQNNSVTVTSGNGGIGNTSIASITVATAPPPPSSVTCPAISSAEVGVAFSSPAITVTGGTPPYTFSVVGTLPAGLTLNTTTGAVTGTPTATGTFSIAATDSTGLVIGTCPFTVNLTVTANAAFLMRYAANLNIGESYIDITNTGANGAPALGPGYGTASGNICVNVYAFDPGEELISCCSCLVTPDQTANLGVNRDLTVKTLTGVVPTSVTVKLLTSLAGGNGAGTSCTNSAAAVTTANLVGGLSAWGTTLHENPVGGYDSTEAPFTPSTLSQSELTSISGRCASILGNGSGFGVCNSCRAGALGAATLSH